MEIDVRCNMKTLIDMNGKKGKLNTPIYIFNCFADNNNFNSEVCNTFRINFFCVVYEKDPLGGKIPSIIGSSMFFNQYLESGYYYIDLRNYLPVLKSVANEFEQSYHTKNDYFSNKEMKKFYYRYFLPADFVYSLKNKGMLIIKYGIAYWE